MAQCLAWVALWVRRSRCCDAGSTFATKIAGAAWEFTNPYKAGAYIAAGLVLYLLTFVVNALARAAVAGAGIAKGEQ